MHLVWFSLFSHKATVEGSIAKEVTDRGLRLLGVKTSSHCLVTALCKHSQKFLSLFYCHLSEVWGV